MPITKPILLGSAALLAAGTGTAHAQAVDGDAEVVGKRVTMSVETPAASNKVTFIYGGERYAARVTETDADDGTKDWARTVKAMRSDRAAGSRVVFRARTCGASGCSTTKFTEVVEWDD